MWQVIRIRMRLASPIAVGPGWRLGFVMLTRLDVPPRTLWGAFTDALTRWRQANPQGNPEISLQENPNPYVAVGTWVETHLRFLPGLLALADDAGSLTERFLPDYELGTGEIFRVIKNNGEVSDSVSNSALKRRLVSGHGSTALTYDRMAAEEAMLHETERIMPHALAADGLTPQTVWLELVVFAKRDSCEGIKNWLETEALSYLRIGRDVAAGDGCFNRVRIEIIDPEKTLNPERLLNHKQEISWDLNQADGPVINATTIQPGNKVGCLRLAGPLLMNKEDVESWKGYWGTLRPHLVREFKKSEGINLNEGAGFGRKLGPPGNESPRWILEYGGLLAVSDSKPHRFILERDGWERFKT